MKLSKIFDKNSIIPFLGLFLIVLVLYWKSLFAFFQGDEWYYFTLTLPYVDLWYGPLIYTYKSLADASSVSSGAHYTPVSNLLYFLSVKFFTFTYWPYALSALLIHVLNTVLIFILVSKFLPKQKFIALTAALFFAISSVHQQAVTWAMTYLWTELSTTFFLLSLIFLLDALTFKKHTKYILYSSLFALLALLTKESTIILFPLIFLVIFLKNKIHLWKTYIKTYGTIFIIYSAYRILLPQFFNWMNSFTAEKAVEVFGFDPGLIIFRAITYPLKSLTQVFVPGEGIKKWAEYLTPLGYPQYSDDMEILGANFVRFTQSAGSDIITYMISVLLLSIIIFSIYKSKKETKALIIFGLSVIGLSAFPLILIATYAPWWGYVTFIDSRHLYITTVGGAILFAIGAKRMADWIAEKRNISFVPILLTLVLLWGYSQYVLIQNDLGKQLNTASQRKTILKEIFNKVPIDKDKKAILVESNQGYYGFSTMPPFQTNLGQILTIYYYQKKQLPEFFINSDFITAGGIRGEGYMEREGKGFGYFISKKTVFDKVAQGKIKLSDVFSFQWDGDKQVVSDNTGELHAEINNLLEVRQRIKDWGRFRDPATGVSFIFPPTLTLSEEIIDSNIMSRIVYLERPQFLAKIEVLKVPEGLGFYDVYSSYKDSDGSQLKGVNVLGFELDSLHKNTVLMANSGSKPKYFIPTHREVISFLVEEAREEDQRMIEQIIGSIEYLVNQ